MKTNLIFSIAILVLSSCLEQENLKTGGGLLAPPEILSDSAAKVESTASKETFAYLSGKITTSGGLEVERGVFIDTAGGRTFNMAMSDPDSLLKYAMQTVPDLSPGVGVFTVKAKLTMPNKKYFYRMYAKNFKGYSVTEADSFKSAPLLCELIKPTPFSIGSDTFRVRSVIVAATLTEPIICRGFVYSKIGGVTLANGTAVIVDSISDINQFRATIRGLEPNTNYRIKSFAKNRGGVGYSPEITVLTKP